MTRPVGDAAKRVFDIAVSSGLLIATSPLLAVVAVAVKVDSPGPVIFRQTRVGRHGRAFHIHKFRTMTAGRTGPLVTTAGDARVTRVGRLLRASKLDELPQLVDVLRGSMSLVGPRPEVPQYVELWPAEARELILSVRPGITDPATVQLRWESDVLARQAEPERYYAEVLLPAKAAAYVDYVEHRTFRGDLRILVSTAREVVATSSAPAG